MSEHARDLELFVIGLSTVIALCVGGVLLWWMVRQDEKDRTTAEKAAEAMAARLGTYMLSPTGRRHRIVKETRMDGSVTYRVQVWYNAHTPQGSDWADCNSDVLPPQPTLEKAQRQLEELYSRQRAQIVVSRETMALGPDQ